MSKIFRENLVKVGARLKAIRRKLGLTLREMQDKTGFSKSLISEIEHGKKSPSSIYLFALADLYEININYVLTGTGEVFINHMTSIFGGDREKIEEMIDYLENHEVIRYYLLTEFTKFKLKNRDILGLTQSKQETGK